MKKRGRKLTLNRETLRALATVHGVLGGSIQFSANTAGCASLARCGGGGTGEGGDTYGACGNTAENCSVYCQTGGACTT